MVYTNEDKRPQVPPGTLSFTLTQTGQLYTLEIEPIFAIGFASRTPRGGLALLTFPMDQSIAMEAALRAMAEALELKRISREEAS